MLHSLSLGSENPSSVVMNHGDLCIKYVVMILNVPQSYIFNGGPPELKSLINLSVEYCEVTFQFRN